MTSRRTRLALAAVAATATTLLGGALPAAATVASHAEVPRATAADSPSDAVPMVRYDFVREYYWLSDCQAEGQSGLGSRVGEWSRYKCINGSSFPGDDYELWVAWN